LPAELKTRASVRFGVRSTATRHPSFSRLLLVVFALIAAVAADVSGRDQTWSSQSYRVEDGLPDGLIHALTQDSDGFLWLGSDVGLTRFDGTEFVNWGGHGDDVLPDTSVRALLSARDRSLWIGLRNGMVTRILEGRPQNYSVRDGLPGGSISALLEDRHGTIWAGSFTGLAHFDNGKWYKLNAKPGLPIRFTVRAILEDRVGSIWVATDIGLFARQSHDHFQLIVGGSIQDVSEDNSGAIWVAEEGRVATRIQAGAPHGMPENRLRTLVEGSELLHDSHGDLWVGTMGQGLQRTEHPEGPLQRVQEDGVFGAVTSMFEDRDGNVWVGTNGLTRFFRHDVTMITSREGLTSNSVRSVLATSDGSMWIATFGELNRFDGPRRIPRQSYRWPAYTLTTRSKGGVWTGAFGIVGSVVDGAHSELPAPPGTRLGIVSAMAEARGELWLCHSGDRWLSRWKAGLLTAVDGPSEIADKQCTAAYADRQGRVWLGFGDGTLAVWAHEQFRVYSAKDGFPTARVSAIREDDTGTLWVATTGGLSRFRNEQFTTWGKRNGLPSDDLNAVVEDYAGHLWLGFAGGIVRIERSELDKAAADSSYRVVYRLFDASDGLRDSPIRSSTPSADRSTDGSLWFTTAKGVAVVDPSRLSTNVTAPRVTITAIRSNLQALTPVPPHVTLPPRTSMLQIDYAAVSLVAASKIKYRYLLEGVDPEWIDAGKRRQAFYTNLSPGSYRFRVSAAVTGGHGVVTDWTFQVEPMFYQTRAFYAANLTIAIALLVAGWRLRLRVLRKQFTLVLAERTRIGHEIHDTLLQHLAATALQLETVANKITAVASPVSAEVRHLRRQVEQYIDEARESILELRRPLVDRRHLHVRLQEWVDRLLEQHAQATIDVMVKGTPQVYPQAVEKHLLRIAQEAIRNAARHAETNHVVADLEYGADTFRLRVQDDGKGFDPQDAGKDGEHWGLIGMRERTKLCGGVFNITSSPGHGTEVEAIFPVGRLQHDIGDRS
jgi:signal transduction histidine kinase/ligand-binding sensor domain-containing protein